MGMLMLAAVWLFLWQVGGLQRRAELATLKSTVGALRTALVLDHLRVQAAAGPGAVGTTQHNPFGLLQSKPVNYLGEMGLLQAIESAPGSWVFDRECVCIAYLPVDPQWHAAPNGGGLITYRVVTASQVPQLRAMAAYRWQGQLLD